MSLTTKPPAGEAGRAPATSVPAGRPAVDPAARASTPDLAARGAPEPALATRTPLDAAGALRILVAEVRAAVIDDLAAAARLPAPVLPDTEPGNAGAALLRWLRSAAAAAGVEPVALRAAFERGYRSALEDLAAGGALGAGGAGLALAREVVLGGLESPPARAPAAGTGAPGVPLYRPDVPARIPQDPPGGAVRQRPAEPRGDAERAGGWRVDPEAALECGRRFFERLLAGPGELFAECWAYPASAWIGERGWAFATPADCARGYGDLVGALGAAGRLPGRVIALAVEPMGATAALLRARLGREASPGAGAGEIAAVLTVVATGRGWRVAAWLLA